MSGQPGSTKRDFIFRQGPADYAQNFTYYAMLHCSKTLPIMLKLCSIFVYVIGWLGVVFGINSASIVNRKK